MARVLDQKVRGIAAVRKDAEVVRLEAEIFLAAQADLALAATHPRIDESYIADLDALGVRTDGDHFADILVTHGQRQLDAAVGEDQLLAAADLVIAVPDV